MFATAFLWLLSGRPPTAAVYGVLLYCGLLACLRGNTGTDTEYYQNMFAGVQLGNIEWSVEGGFALLGQLLMASGLTPELAVRGVSALFFALLGIYLARATVYEKWTLLTFILPVFAYQYSMNGLRIGLASAVLLLCAQAIRRSTSSARFAWLIVPVIVHISTLLSGLYLLAARLAQTAKGAVAMSLLAVSAFLVVWLSAGNYLLDKQAVYEAMVSPGDLSGLSRMVVIAVLLLGVWTSSLSKVDKTLIVTPAVLLAIAAWMIARSSFAGLRFLDLLSFVVPVATCVALGGSAYLADRKFALAVLAAGLLGTLAVARNFSSEAGEGESPFVPYQLWTTKPGRS